MERAWERAGEGEKEIAKERENREKENERKR